MLISLLKEPKNIAYYCLFANMSSKEKLASKDELKRKLTPAQYEICINRGTAFSGKYRDCKMTGIYKCVCCGNDLFGSDRKFDSGIGWPSFWASTNDENIKEETDSSLFMRRTEVMCNRCVAHLEHVFDDGPEPTGLRYYINSALIM
jgi:peptide-methionine (R)-S-oxide reductase